MGNIFLHFSEAFDYIEEKGWDRHKTSGIGSGLALFTVEQQNVRATYRWGLRAFAPGS
jgi:hypothetical protein